ncbi:uncharacterized protein LOC110980080 isoform X3 [Acanthaster planci]|uniref:Uncharacterized protein LOC110980080 isoform X3 n=1 Tax=Acanthaster planci TaxID=133434 RepID=A0A8B7YKP3_ACAPL|nr:uncharacterized protein LOC110980080 isoform X3 [Acanthaster planci]
MVTHIIGRFCRNAGDSVGHGGLHCSCCCSLKPEGVSFLNRVVIMEDNPFPERKFGAHQGGALARGRHREDNQKRHQGYQRRVDNQHGQERGRGGYGCGRGQGRGRGGGHFRNAGQHHPDGGEQQRKCPVRQPGYKMLESLLDEEKCAAEVVQ